MNVNTNYRLSLGIYDTTNKHIFRSSVNNNSYTDYLELSDESIKLAQKNYKNSLEKYASGETLSETEKAAMIIRSAYSSKFGEDYINASKERVLKINGQMLENKFTNAGIKLNESDSFEITFHGFEGKVEGLDDIEKQNAINHILNNLSYNELSSITNCYDNKSKVPNYFANTTNEQRRLSAEMGIAEYVLKQYDSNLSLQDLHLGKDGIISGLPSELKELFENNRVSNSRNETESRYTLEEMKVFEMKQCMYDSVKAVANRGYENISRYDYKFKYSNCSLSLVDYEY